MLEPSYAFLKTLLHTPSPSGFERQIQDVVRGWAKPLAHEIRTDRHGNVLAVLNPKGSPRIMLAGHCDQIALMVQHIDDAGFLYVQPMGGWDMQILLGQKLMIWAKAGGVPGVVARKAPHLLTGDERNKVPQFQDIWVDIGAKDRADAETLITSGDSVTVELSCRELCNGMISGPGLDDKVGVWTVMETLRLLHNQPLKAAVYCVSTVQEEIGLRGATTSAYGIHPTVGIAVDVTHATDTPGNEKKQLGDTKLGAGPVIFRGPNINPHVCERLTAAAKANEIPMQPRGVPRATGTDANAIQLTRDGVAAGLIGIPNRYMHSPVEIVSLQDMDRAAKLLAEFCLSVTAEMDWVP
jgi:putative aminopeptidase FrvX